MLEPQSLHLALEGRLHWSRLESAGVQLKAHFLSQAELLDALWLWLLGPRYSRPAHLWQQLAEELVNQREQSQLLALTSTCKGTERQVLRCIATCRGLNGAAW